MRTKETNTISTYFSEITKFELLTPEEEYELAVRAKQGDETARERLVTANLRFVVKIAKEYTNRGLPLSDLISEGNIGLVKAISQFEPNRDVRLTSYAVWWIRQTILKALSENSRAIRLPENRVNELFRIKKCAQSLTGNETESEKIARISKCVGIPENVVLRIMRACKTPVSFDTKVANHSDDTTIGDVIEDKVNISPEKFAEIEYIKDEIEVMLEKLSDREAEIIRYRFGLNGYPQLSLGELGEMFDLTKERIRQIEKRGLEKLNTRRNFETMHAYVA